MHTEVWRPVVGYEGLYEVSSLGRVATLNYKNTKTRRLLSIAINTNWYQYINIYKNKIRTNIRVHRLVASAFLDNPNSKICVNHINGIKIDNSIGNLEWATYSDNISHAYKTWLNKQTEKNLMKNNNPAKWKFGSHHNTARRINQYTIDNKFIRTWWSIIEATNYTKAGHITGCCKWDRKTAWGFIWKYADK